jgi:hypothetical protein
MNTLFAATVMSYLFFKAIDVLSDKLCRLTIQG